MTSRTTLIAVICGLAAAAFFVSPLSLGSFGMALSSFTAAPLLIAALGFGTLAGIIAGLAAVIVVGAFIGPLGALAVAGVTVAPALLIGHWAGLMRNDDGVEEWFPLSELLVRMVLIVAAIALVMGAIVGYSQEWAVEQVSTLIDSMIAAREQAGGEAAIAPEAAKAQALAMARVIPIAMPASLLLLLVLNLNVAMKFARARGWVLRPQDDIPTATALPLWAVGAFAIGIALAFIGGTVGLIGMVVAGAFGGGFILVGLATLHDITRGQKGRAFMLGITYGAILLTRFVAPIIAIFGVAETLFGLRARRAGRPPKT